MSMCRVFSCVVGKRVFAMTKVFSLPCFILYSKAKFACYSRCFLTSYFCIPVPCNEKDIFWGVVVLKGLVGLHKTIQLQLLWHLLLGHRLGLLWCRVACLGNEPRSHCFISAVQYCSTEASQVALVVKSPPAKAGDLRDAGSIPGSGSSPGGGHSNPLQYYCLKNPMDRGAWRATVHRVTELDLTEATEHKQFYK